MRTGSTESSTGCRSGRDRYLVMAPNWLGDAVMATPLLSVLRKSAGGLLVDVGCRAYVSEVFRRHPDVDRSIVYDGRGSWREAARTLRRERPPKNWRACIVLPPSFSSALAACLAGARRRTGFAAGGRSFLLHRSLARPGRDEHLSRSFVRLAEAATEKTAGGVPRPVVVPPYDWEQRIASHGIDGPYLVVTAGAAYGSAKRWPVERFAEVARRVFGRGLQVVVAGAPGERDAVEPIARAGSGRNLAGEIDTADFLCLLRGAACVLGNDSGPVHLSAAMGRPTVAVFGSTSPAWTAPRGARVRVVRAGLDCSPCFRRRCPDGEPACLAAIGVDEVDDAVAAAIEEERRA